MRARSARLAVLALPLTLGMLAVGVGSANQPQSSNWGDNGSETCTLAEGSWSPSQGSAQLGTYCMMAVTGWIQIYPQQTQVQAISCASNAPGASPGLSWSVYNNTIDDTQANGMPWYQLANGPVKASPGSPADTTANVTGWQTATKPALATLPYPNPITFGSVATGTYGSGGIKVQNPYMSGGPVAWQGAIACVNSAGAALQGAYQSERPPRAAAAPRGERQVTLPLRAPRIADLVIDAVDSSRGRAFLAKQYALRKNVTRTATRTCPAGMVRTGRLAYTVQQFPADRRAPKPKDFSVVDVQLAPKGRNAGVVSMTLTKAKNPTVVQFQMHCARR